MVFITGGDGRIRQCSKIQSRIIAIDMELQNINIRQMTLEAMKPQLEAALIRQGQQLNNWSQANYNVMGLAKHKYNWSREAELERVGSLRKPRAGIGRSRPEKILTQDLI